MYGPANNALQLTGRGGAAVWSRRRPVVEARPAAERECSTLDAATDWPQGNGLQSAGRSHPAMNQQIPSTGGSPQQMVGVPA